MRRQRIAVIGSGISGLATAWLLRDRHELTLYEGGDHLGGHTHTHRIDDGGRSLAVDTGFIVYNTRTYPLLCRLFDALGIASRDTTMSFSVNDPAKNLYWNGHDLRRMFAQKLNLLRPRFYGMLADVLKFNRAALGILSAPPELRLDTCLQRLGIGRWCREDYILPMGAAIWSASTASVEAMPACFFARFLHQHGMLSIDDRPQWRTVDGGSANYVERILKDLPPVERQQVHRVRRVASGVSVDAARGSRHFDHVVIATHADQALALLEAPSAAEQEGLSAFPYTANCATLHRDSSLLPPRSAWAAWNYQVGADRQRPATVTYHCNILQGLDSQPPFLVTLGDASRIDPSLRIKQITYRHPSFIPASLAVQAEPQQVSGVDRLHYAGAYWGYGFHEDGLASAVRVAKELGVDW